MHTYPDSYQVPQRRELLSDIQRAWLFWICARVAHENPAATRADAMTHLLVYPAWNNKVLKMDHEALDPSMPGGERQAFLMTRAFQRKFPVNSLETLRVQAALGRLSDDEKSAVHALMVTCGGLSNELKLAGRLQKLL